jgi:hypothetical protein
MIDHHSIVVASINGMGVQIQRDFKKASSGELSWI